MRGLHLIDDTAIIGVSAFRESFHNLPNASSDIKAGLIFVNIQSGEETARLLFEDSLSEFFSVTTLPSPQGKPVRHAIDMGSGHYFSIDHELPTSIGSSFQLN